MNAVNSIKIITMLPLAGWWIQEEHFICWLFPQLALDTAKIIIHLHIINGGQVLCISLTEELWTGPGLWKFATGPQGHNMVWPKKQNKTK